MGGTSRNSYRKIDQDLTLIHKKYVKVDQLENHLKKTTIEKLLRKVVTYMKKVSPSLKTLNPSVFGVGSSYNGLKINSEGDFDIDLVLTLPAKIQPVLSDDTIPGFVTLNLRSLEKLQNSKPDLYKFLKSCVDENNYMLTNKLQSNLMQSIFDQAQNRYFSDGCISVEDSSYKIVRIQRAEAGPACTLTICGSNFSAKIDFVPCIRLSGDCWPKGAFRANPFPKPKDFFIVPKKPRGATHPHIERYFALSFIKQEKLLMKKQNYVKPTLRVMKFMNKKLKHDVPSFAIKTLFLTELQENDSNTSWKNSFSFCFVYMLQKYLDGLENGIWYFWYTNKKFNLLNLTVEQKNQYKKRDPNNIE